MSRRSRVLVAVVLGPIAVAVLAGGVGAAGVAFGLVPGNSTSTTQVVSASFIDAQGDNISVGVVSGRQSFRSRGGAAITEDTTTVTVVAFTPDGVFGSGCWTAPASPFKIAADNSATLTFDSSAPGVAPCPGSLTSPGLPFNVNLTPVTTDDGVQSAVVMSVQWTPAGVASERRTTLDMTCQTFQGVSQQDWVQQNSNATADITSLTVVGFDFSTNLPVTLSFAGSFSTNFAVVTSITDDQIVNGPSTGTCGPFGNP
jgi:hypothetical protein